jgi:tRNA nucleotidyltransferase (CCA-adding enzyme)
VSDATLRRWLCLVTPELSKDLLVLMGVLARVRKGPEGERTVVALSGRIKAVLAENPALTLRDLDLGGKDLVTELGIPPGRVIGETLRQLLASVLDDPSLNERERLLELAKGILQNAN